MTDPDREPTEPTLLDRYGFSTVPEGKITGSETVTIHDHQDLIDRDACTTISRFQNQCPWRHTHLQRVARCIQPGSGGGGWC